jgi:hypothetical protein
MFPNSCARIRSNELIFVCLAFDAAGAAGTAPTGTSGKQACFVCVSVLFSTCLHCLLECLGFIWYVVIAVPMLPIPEHGVCKDSPGCGHEHPSLVSMVTCMYEAQMVEEYQSM